MDTAPMNSLNRDTIIAIVLLLVSGGLMIASFDIREPDYGQLSPATWPRTIVVALVVLSLIYLLQSIRARTSGDVDLPEVAGGDEAKNNDPRARTPGRVDLTEAADGDEAKNVGPRVGLAGFFAYWRNVIWCFVLFLAYLLTMPYLGMLIGGVSFAFLLLTALGGWEPRQILLHAAIAIICVGGMWALFTFGLKVPLPSGMILPRF